MNNVTAVLIKLLLFIVILAVYQLVCAYTSMTILFFFQSVFFYCKPYFIYVLIICCLHCDSFHIHMKLYFDWIYGKIKSKSNQITVKLVQFFRLL